MTELVAYEAPDMSTLTLDELATIASDAHAEVREHLAGAVHSAIRAGRAVYAAHHQLAPQGEQAWIDWCAKTLGMSSRVASDYERLAVYAGDLPAEAFEPYITRNGTVRQPTMTRALTYVRGLPEIRFHQRRQSKVNPTMRAEAERLHASGASQAAIAELLGISQTTVCAILNPEKYRARKRRESDASRRRKRERRAAAAQAEKRRVAELVASTGGNLGVAVARTGLLQRKLEEAYAQTRQLEQVVGHITPATKGARRQIDIAQTALHTVEDALVRAIKAGGEAE